MPYKVFDHSDLMEMSEAEGGNPSLEDSMGQLEQQGYSLHSVMPNFAGQWGENHSKYIFYKPETGKEVFDRYTKRQQ